MKVSAQKTRNFSWKFEPYYKKGSITIHLTAQNVKLRWVYCDTRLRMVLQWRHFCLTFCTVTRIRILIILCMRKHLQNSHNSTQNYARLSQTEWAHLSDLCTYIWYKWNDSRTFFGMQRNIKKWSNRSFGSPKATCLWALHNFTPNTLAMENESRVAQICQSWCH